jgi:predicted metal-binding membrane protein
MSERSPPAPAARVSSLDRRWTLAFAMGALALACWAALWLWSTSPYARYLAHDGWGDDAAFAALCRALPGGDVVAPLVVHALAWLLMIGAMMLPTTYPLMSMFRRATAARADATRLALLVVAGYVAAWLAFGVVAHGLDAALRWLASGSAWLFAHGREVTAGVLAGVGLFQFSSLKYRCLDKCRAPFGFVTSRWHGREPRREAFRIGLDHGMFCVGCCWALMLVMFVVGTGSLGWMLALALAMAAEKNLSFGRKLSAPIGIGLLGAAAALLLTA